MASFNSDWLVSPGEGVAEGDTSPGCPESLSVPLLLRLNSTWFSYYVLFD